MSAAAGFCKSCVVYLHRTEQRAVVAPLFMETEGTAGLYFEDDQVWVGDVSHLEHPALEAFEASQPRHRSGGFRELKLTDWPSFRASGLRSVREFQTKYVRYDIQGANSANVVAVITSQEIVPEISLSASCNPKVAFDDLLVRLHKCFLAWQAA